MEQLNGTNKLLICVKFCSHFQRLCKLILIIINNDVAFASASASALATASASTSASTLAQPSAIDSLTKEEGEND